MQADEVKNGLRKAADTHSLLERAQRGEVDAFAALCEGARLRVWRAVASVTRGGAETDDLAQEAILRAFRSLSSFRGETSFDVWICRIALNAAHDYQKSAWRRRIQFWSQTSEASFGEEEYLRSATVPGAHIEAERRELQKRVRAAVAGLGSKERVPIYLIYFEEFSLADVARLECIPESTVRSRVKTGLKRLADALDDLQISDDEVQVLSATELTASEPVPPQAGRTDGHPHVSMFTSAIVGDWKGFPV